MSESRASFTLNLLGAFRLQSADGSSIDISSRRGKALLAMLATASHGERTRAWLEDKLWGSRSQDQARASLRRELSNLRTTLNGGGTALLISDREKVRLNLNLVRIDVRQPAPLGGGFGVGRSEFLEGLDIAAAEGFEDWLREQRSTLREGRVVPRSDDLTVVIPMPADPRTPAAPSLAVMPFDNLSGDSSLTFFCDGVSEEIQRTVAQNSDLKVLARSSTFQLRDAAEKAADKVSARLGVSHLLDGRVRRIGSTVRISAELVECATGRALWANRYDGTLEDVFALQDEIAKAVAQALRMRLAPPTTTVALDPATYEMFLQARGILAAGNPLFDKSGAEATPLLEDVVRRAPGYAGGWELLAIARAWTLRSRQGTTGYAEGRPGVVYAAERALALDPKRGSAYGALAMLEPFGAYAARERLLGLALDAAPHDPAALTEMSTFYWTVGRFNEALRLAEQACELNPLMPAARLQVAQMRAYVGDYETSIRMLRDLYKRLEPRNAGVLLSLMTFSASLGYWDAYAEAAAEIETFDVSQVRDLRASRAYAEALRSKDPEQVAERVRRYTELLDKTGTLPLNLVEAISTLGMPARALELAERASYAHIFDPEGAPHSDYFPGTVLGPWSELHRTPRFIDLCDRLGLCAYWATSGFWPDCAAWTPYDLKAEVHKRVARDRRA